jgi:iron complex outermembrane recepter protein
LKQFIFICFCFICIQTETLIAQCNLSIKATVLNTSSQHALPVANVFLYKGDTVIANASKGEFLFNFLCKGEYELLLTATGYDTMWQHLDLTSNWQSILYLTPKAKILNAVQVKSTNYHKQNFGLNNHHLESSRGQNIAELLSKMNGVQLLQTGANISKPVINGLSGNRVVLVNNGIRLESQQWGNDHAPEIDAFAVQQVRLVYGAELLKYSGDAIGGLVLMDKNPIATDSHFHGKLHWMANSNNKLVAMHYSTEGLVGKAKNTALRWQTSIRKAGDSRAPKYNLSNTGFSEISSSIELLKEKKNKKINYTSSIFASKLGVFAGSHVGNITDLNNILKTGQVPDYVKNIPFSYNVQRPNQEVLHSTAKRNVLIQKNNYTSLEHNLSLQWNYRAEYDKKKFASSSNSPQLALHLLTMAQDVHIKTNQRKVTHHYGMQHWLQINRYQSRLFIPNYNLYHVAPYYFVQYKKKSSFLEAGVRLDNRYQWNIISNKDKTWHNRLFTSVNGSINAGKTYKHHFVSIHLTASTRTPNMNELYSDGLHHGASRIEKGDTTLQQEKAISVGFIHKLKTNKVDASTVINYKTIHNFIYLNPSFPPQLTIRGAFPLFTFQQTDAVLFSINHQTEYTINAHWKWYSAFSVLYAWDATQQQWLSQMPANHGSMAIQYKIPDMPLFKNNRIGLEANYFAQQKRIPAFGNIPTVNSIGDTIWQSDYIMPPASYQLFNLQLFTNINLRKKQIPIIFSAQNILNTTYRNYLNAFRYFSDEPGRTFTIRVQYNF